MKVLIVGTGYVGLTTGVALGYLGHKVTCLDIATEKIEKLKAGIPPIYEPGLEDLLLLAAPNMKYTDSYDDADINEVDVIFISVNTPPSPDGSPNLSYVRMAAEEIGQRMGKKFTVIVNKSTVPIGSGNWVGALVRDAFANVNGHNPDNLFAVASNPEFLREGVALHDTLYPDRIVIGSSDPRALDVLTNLYRPLLNQDFVPPEFLSRPEGLSAVPMVTTDLASAELIKYAANAFLALKISYINEVAQLAEKVGADITQIAKGIGLDNRIGSRFLEAGIGWGGSCFGKDTSALVTTAEDYRLNMTIVKAARQVNYTQREWMVEKLLNELKILKGRTIALFGLAFKPNTDDLRDAPALDIATRLIQRGAKVKAHDPIALENARRYFGDLGIHYYDDPVEAAADADAIILITNWADYRKLNWSEIREKVRIPLILDGRNFLPEDQLEQIGFTVIGVGRAVQNSHLFQANGVH